MRAPTPADETENLDRLDSKRHLLQVLQDASVAEVVDVPAEVYQLRVNVGGHAAVGGRGEVGAAGHHAGATGWGTLGPPLHQGTISVHTNTHTHTHRGGGTTELEKLHLSKHV